jgi:hypothetical protein
MLNAQIYFKTNYFYDFEHPTHPDGNCALYSNNVTPFRRAGRHKVAPTPSGIIGTVSARFGRRADTEIGPYIVRMAAVLCTLLVNELIVNK